MIGLGKWEGNIKTIVFKSRVVVTIADNNGAYDIDVKLLDALQKETFEFHDIKEEGNKLSGKGTLSLFAGKEFDASVEFNGDTMNCLLENFPVLRTVRIKDAKKVD